LDVGEEFPGYGLEHAEPQGLKPDVRVVEFLNGWLNEQDFHETKLAYFFPRFSNSLSIAA